MANRTSIYPQSHAEYVGSRECRLALDWLSIQLTERLSFRELATREVEGGPLDSRAAHIRSATEVLRARLMSLDPRLLDLLSSGADPVTTRHIMRLLAEGRFANLTAIRGTPQEELALIKGIGSEKAQVILSALKLICR